MICNRYSQILREAPSDFFASTRSPHIPATARCSVPPLVSVAARGMQYAAIAAAGRLQRAALLMGAGCTVQRQHSWVLSIDPAMRSCAHAVHAFSHLVNITRTQNRHNTPPHLRRVRPANVQAVGYIHADVPHAWEQWPPWAGEASAAPGTLFLMLRRELCS